MKEFITISLSLSLLAIWIIGCAPPAPMFWAHPDNSFKVFSKDQYTCLQESQQQTSSAKYDLSGGKATSHAVTNNLLFDSCMYARGYFKSPVDVYMQEKDKLVNSKIGTNNAKPETKQYKKQVESETELQTLPQSTSSSSATMAVSESIANFRKNPSTNADVLKKLKKGEEVRLIARQGEWLQVELSSGEVGWCHKGVLTNK